MVTMTPKVAALALVAVLLCLASVITPFLLFSNSTETLKNNLSANGSQNSKLPPQPLPSKTAVPNPIRSIDTPAKVRGFLSLYKVPVAIALGALVLAIVASIIVSVVVLSTKHSDSTSAIEDVPTEIKPEDNPDPESMEELVDSSPIPPLGVAGLVLLVVVANIIAAYFYFHYGGISGCMVLAKFNKLWKSLGGNPKGDYKSHFEIRNGDTITLKEGVKDPNLTIGEVALILLDNLGKSKKRGSFNLVRDGDWTDQFGNVRGSIFFFPDPPLNLNISSDVDYLLGHVGELSNIYTMLKSKVGKTTASPDPESFLDLD